jgi:hypothetical protein
MDTVQITQSPLLQSTGACPLATTSLFAPHAGPDSTGNEAHPFSYSNTPPSTSNTTRPHALVLSSETLDQSSNKSEGTANVGFDVLSSCCLSALLSVRCSAEGNFCVDCTEDVIPRHKLTVESAHPFTCIHSQVIVLTVPKTHLHLCQASRMGNFLR